MKTTPRQSSVFILCAALVVGAALTALTPLEAANATWSGTSSTDFETSGNWTGGTGGGGATAPAPANDLTTDIGLFTGTVTSNQPSLSASRNITGLTFSTATGGWTLGSSSSSNVLTLGASGITATAQTSGTTTINANLGIGANQTWGVGTGGTLLLNGSISEGTSGSPSTFQLALGNTSATNNGTITLNPTGTNSVNIYTNNNTFALQAATGSAGSSKIVNLGSGANSTSSTNILSNAGGAGIRTTYGATLNVNSGTWSTNEVGANGSNASTGTITINGGTLRSGAGRYVLQYGTTATNGAGTLNVAGGAYIQTNGGFQQSNAGFLLIGNSGFVGTAAVASMNVSAGFVDLAKGQNSSNSGALQVGGGTAGLSTQSNTALYNQSGGVTQIGVTAATNVFTGAASASSALTGVVIGGNTAVGTNYNSTALTLGGGRLNVAGTITGAGATTLGTGSIQNLNLVGGTLTAGGIDMTRLGSSATATAAANQVATSTNIGTLVNRGTTLSPGGQFISTSTDSYGNVTVTLTPVTGQTTITGNYSGTGAGTISIKLGGKTASTAFQDTGLGNFSNLAVSGTVSLNDTLSLSLLPGYAPTVNDTFKIITASSVSGTFVQGSTITTSSGGFDYNFGIGYNANDVTLTLNSITASAIPEPSTYAGLAGVMALVAAMVYRRRKSRWITAS